ncbi:MAG: putative glycoside hydrolase, partial [Acidimicrobiia bacterium]
ARRTQFRLLVALTIVWALWAGWSLLGRATPYTLRVLDDLGSPIAAASIDVNSNQIGTSADDGTIRVEWNRSSTVLEVSAPGHVPQVVTVAERPDGVVDVVLKARVLRGRVTDNDGDPVEAVRVVAGPASGVTDAEGRFNLRGAEPGPVQISRPAWVATTFDWDGGVGESVVQLAPFIARAVHISGEAARDDIDHFFEMAESTELNALMLDLKDESGLVWYDSEDPLAAEVGAIRGVYDLSAIAARAEEADLYLIGRLVVFNDPTAAIRKPEMAVWDSEANAPYQANNQYFLDPTDPDARAYGLSLAEEVCEMGVDEVQFDYVRFPDKRTESTTFDQGVSLEVRTSTIINFLDEAVALLHPMGCAVGADVFGFTTAATDDGGIGQRWEDVTQIVDVASPMVYPSHYGTGWYGFDTPNDHPGPMVTRAIEDGMERLPRNVVVRPWLQDFGYTPDQVRAQIEVAEQFGLGWMLWNAASNVTVDALSRLE